MGAPSSDIYFIPFCLYVTHLIQQPQVSETTRDLFNAISRHADLAGKYDSLVIVLSVAHLVQDGVAAQGAGAHLGLDLQWTKSISPVQDIRNANLCLTI